MNRTSQSKSQWSNYFEYCSSKLLTLLLAADILFMLLYLVWWLPNSSELNQVLSQFIIYKELLLITQDQSYGEVFQYIKELWIALILGYGFCQRRKFLFLAWSLLFAYLLFDDLLSIHEIVGIKIGQLLNFQAAFGLRASDFGEIFVSATVGCIFLIFISWGYTRGNYRDRLYGKLLVWLLLSLAVPGILFDLIHVQVNDSSSLFLLFALLEDGGEHIVMSLTLAVVYAFDWHY